MPDSGPRSAVGGVKAAQHSREHIPGIDVVVPVFNKLRLLAEAVGSVVAAAEAHGETAVWLVDNGSTDGSYEFLLERFGRRVQVLRLESGTIAAVRNFGAQRGTAPIISFIDCDCLVPSDYFERLETVMKATVADGTGCPVVLPPNPTWVEAVWNRMHDDGGEGIRSWINSANFAVRREMFERIGGFNEACETDEDTEICFRIRRAGGQLVSDRRLEIAHLDNAKTLPAFFRKERWRGLGMFSTVSQGGIDKPTAMMIAHVLALVSAIAVIALAPIAMWLRVGLGLALALLVPTVTVMYRRRFSAASFGVVPAIVLYELFYLARINALVRIAARSSQERR